MQRHLEQRLLVGELDDAAEIHHRDAMADVLDHGEVVGDEQVGEFQFLLQVHQQVDDLRLDRHVERRYRLVADDQVGAEGERTGDADALALAAGEFVRVGAHRGRPEADSLEQGGGPFLALGRRAFLVDDHRLAHDLAGRHARVQRGVGILVDHLHAPPVGQHGGTVEMGDVLAVDPDGAAGGLQQFQQRAAHRRLAAAAFADQAQRLAAPDGERHTVDGIDMARNTAEHALVDRKVLLEVADLEESLGHAAPLSRLSACQHATQ